MNSYIADISFALLMFPLVAALCVGPYAIIQYRSYGAVNLWKTFVVFSFIFYLMCMIFLVLMPLPADRTIVVPGALTPQLLPFHTITEIIATSGFALNDPSTWIPALRTSPVYTTLFNILMTIPLGFYFRYLFGMRWWQALCFGALTSLLFEITQYTGIYGIYEHPYRYADIDDLITNTTGTMLGFWFAIPIGALLPNLDKIDSESASKGALRVSAPRRCIAFLIDMALVVIGVVLIQVVLGVIGLTTLIGAEDIAAEALSGAELGGEGHEGAALADAMATIHTAWAWLKATLHLSLNEPLEFLGLITAIVAIVFIIVPIITGGQTAGQALVRIKIVTVEGNRPQWWRYLVRYGVLWVIGCVPLLALVLFPGASIAGISFAALAKALLVIYGLWAATLVLRAIFSHFDHRFLLLDDLLSQTMIVPSRALAPENTQDVLAS